MNKELAEEIWKDYIGRKKEYFSNLYRDLKFEYAEPVLDIGGGPGAFLNFFGIEKADILDIAGGKSLAGDYNFIEADLTSKLPKLKKKYKTIFVMETLEHIKNPLYLMAQVYDIMDDEGVGYISVPYTPLDLDRSGQENSVMCHVCRWKLEELRDQLSKLGFMSRVIQKRRRFKNTAFYLPHCWLVLKIKKRLEH
ncbi:MAG: class I SAM-dependent methyltransferase [Nanoarchaeota archaeon]|nr:class I SAM-dependent methyltransferase [Nanoarchaeota archaeon]